MIPLTVTELDASNGGWIQTLSDGTWIQSLLRGCIPGVLASGGYHFGSPGLIAAVGPHIWVFGRDGARVLTDPAARPGPRRTEMTPAGRWPPQAVLLTAGIRALDILRKQWPACSGRQRHEPDTVCPRR